MGEKLSHIVRCILCMLVCVKHTTLQSQRKSAGIVVETQTPRRFAGRSLFSCLGLGSGSLSSCNSFPRFRDAKVEN